MSNTQRTNLPNYDFIDNIRAMAIISVVAEHCITFDNFSYQSGSAKQLLFLGLIQLSKFGTISFFLVAGFLLGDKFAEYGPMAYLKRRSKNTLRPWAFWTLIYVGLILIVSYYRSTRYHTNDLGLRNILYQLKRIYFYSNYWFVLNLMISTCILLIFKKKLFSLSLGAILFVFTVFYACNIHFEWIVPVHTTAVLGFVFFLWLGALIRKHWSLVCIVLDKIPSLSFVAILLVTFDLGVFEMIKLHGKSMDPYNTLRVSNILFSLTVFAVSLKYRDSKILNMLEPEKTTYGIYLVHYLLIVFVLIPIMRALHLNFHRLDIPGFLIYKSLVFLSIYVVAFAIVRSLWGTSAAWLIGANERTTAMAGKRHGTAGRPDAPELIRPA